MADGRRLQGIGGEAIGPGQPTTGRAALLARCCMTFDPFRGMRDAVPKEPLRVSQDEGTGSWLGLAFALAMLILAAWYFWGDSMRSSIRADAPSSTSPPRTQIVEHK